MVYLEVLWVVSLLKKTTGYGQFLLALWVVPSSVAKLMGAELNFSAQLGSVDFVLPASLALIMKTKSP